MEFLLSNLSQKTKKLIVNVGDLFIDTMTVSKNSKRLKELWLNFNTSLHIVIPTRKAKTSIDHIMSNISSALGS